MDDNTFCNILNALLSTDNDTRTQAEVSRYQCERKLQENKVKSAKNE